jgi:hypothetical protein
VGPAPLALGLGAPATPPSLELFLASPHPRLPTLGRFHSSARGAEEVAPRRGMELGWGHLGGIGKRVGHEEITSLQATFIFLSLGFAFPVVR